MKKNLIPVTCLAATFLVPTSLSAAGVVVFNADFESGLAANTGTIAYNAGDNQLVTMTTSPDAVLGTQSLLTDPTSSSAAATNIRFTPTTSVTLGSGNSAVFSFDFAIRRTNGPTKSHFVTGYNSSNSIIFQFVLGESNEFGNGGGDRQRPGYATSGGITSFVAGDIASGTNPGSFWFGGDGNPGDGFNANEAHFDLSINSDGWTVSSLRSSGADSFVTNSLPTFDGSIFSDLAYVELTGESGDAGGYLDNVSITAVPEPTSVALLGLGFSGFLLRRRR